ncbi:uncharacterized protein TrAFT101_005377 [Trichoderma asperellum]|uniref:uncharacterized protein n=1 Tax=Trichoderma asperellum TaxID=101201 RepID=UPI00333412E2|nr:hypothetical protein TrAFT101_005377 [Trichoderma asperellum]
MAAALPGHRAGRDGTGKVAAFAAIVESDPFETCRAASGSLMGFQGRGSGPASGAPEELEPANAEKWQQ